LNGGYL